MPPLIRAELGHRKIELDDVRTRLAKTLGVDEQPLTKLRRVTWRSLLNVGPAGVRRVRAHQPPLRSSTWSRS